MRKHKKMHACCNFFASRSRLTYLFLPQIPFFIFAADSEDTVSGFIICLGTKKSI